MKKLAIIITHPIQYYAPLFKLLAQKINLKVFYTIGDQENQNQFEPGFGHEIRWDIPLLEGYPFKFVKNIATKPNSHAFNGIINPTLNDCIANFNPDAILIYGWSYRSHLHAIRHFKGQIPVWFRGDSTLLDNASAIKELLRKRVLKWVYASVDKAFYVGTASKAYFLRAGLKPTQLIFAPHAIDNQRFSAERSAEASQIRNSMGIAVNDILILFVGKLEEKKNPMLLLKAFLNITQSNLHLAFAGNGILKKALEAASTLDTKNSSRIHFLDFQNQQKMPALYQACDLCCLPSQGPGETWGLVVNEAMAAGKAVLVSSKVGCAIDLVQQQTNGAIFESGNLSDLTEKLQLLTKDKNTLHAMGMKSQSIIANWNFSKQVEAFINQLNATN